MAVALHTGDKGSAPAAHNTRGKAASVGAGAVQAMNLTRPDARSARTPYPGLFPLRKPSAQRRLGRREAPTTDAGVVGCAPAADAWGSSSQPKRSWLAGCDNGSRWRLCPARYLSRPTGEPGGPEGDTPQTEVQGQKPETVRRRTRLVDRRGRPPGPGGVRGAWEMAPRSRSAGAPPVNPGSPETTEEPTIGPDQEGTTRPRQGKPGSPERVEERTTVPTKKGRRGQPGPTGKKGRTDGRSRPRRDIHKLSAGRSGGAGSPRGTPAAPRSRTAAAGGPAPAPAPRRWRRACRARTAARAGAPARRG